VFTLEERQYDMIFIIKKLLHKSPFWYELWQVKGHQDEDTKVVYLDELGQANVKADTLAKSFLASTPQDQLLLSWE